MDKKTLQHLNPVALTIAGSDSGAGAGIQADLKTFAAHSVYGCSVVTMVTAQSTQTVDAVELLPSYWITAQLATVFADFSIRALKTGALGNIAIIGAVAEFLALHAPLALVIDPVMISKHGHVLLSPDAVDTMQNVLFPQALVVTPNLHEAAALTDSGPITSRSGMLQAAEKLIETGCRAVLIKGGHMEAEPVDLLLEGGRTHMLESERVITEHTHGTGCTFSAAITAGLVKGLPLVEAVTQAKEYITGALRYGQLFGHGINPVNHFWRSDTEFGVIKPS